jgi:hypothetical protein
MPARGRVDFLFRSEFEFEDPGKQKGGERNAERPLERDD